MARVAVFLASDDSGWLTGRENYGVRRLALRAPPTLSAFARDTLLPINPIFPLFLPLLALNGNRQRTERRRGSAPQLQGGGNEQELIHLILRQVFQPHGFEHRDPLFGEQISVYRNKVLTVLGGKALDA